MTEAFCQKLIRNQIGLKTGTVSLKKKARRRDKQTHTNICGEAPMNTNHARFKSRSAPRAVGESALTVAHAFPPPPR